MPLAERLMSKQDMRYGLYDDNFQTELATVPSAINSLEYKNSFSVANCTTKLELRRWNNVVQLETYSKNMAMLNRHTAQRHTCNWFPLHASTTCKTWHKSLQLCYACGQFLNGSKHTSCNFPGKKSV